MTYDEYEIFRKTVARSIYDILEGPIVDHDFGRQKRQWELSVKLADTAIAMCMVEAARAARGPVLRTLSDGTVWIRGTEQRSYAVDGSSEYGTGRMDAAAAIVALAEEGK